MALSLEQRIQFIEVIVEAPEKLGQSAAPAFLARRIDKIQGDGRDPLSFALQLTFFSARLQSWKQKVDQAKQPREGSLKLEPRVPIVDQANQPREAGLKLDPRIRKHSSDMKETLAAALAETEKNKPSAQTAHAHPCNFATVAISAYNNHG